MKKKSLQIVTVNLYVALDFIKKYNSCDLTKKAFHRFSIGVTLHDKLVGVALVGKPGSIRLHKVPWMQVTCVATDGTANAESKLYAACWRICREMGYKQLITYVPLSDEGTALKGAGWVRYPMPENKIFLSELTIVTPDKQVIHLGRYYARPLNSMTEESLH
jgi:hypothetical protein